MSRSLEGESAENGVGDDEEEEEEEDDELDDELDASHLQRFMRDRRRAQSLPAYPAALLDRVPGDGDSDGGGKRVKFADSLGLNLASVKHFSALDEPRIPTKVLSRHRSFPPQQPDPLPDRSFQSAMDTDRLVACFPEPDDAERRAQRLRVALDTITITQFDVRGHIRVLRGDPDDDDDDDDRQVGVRYTFNDWLSHVDAQALPAAAEPPGGAAQRFAFTVYTPPFMDPSSAVHFAVYLRCRHGEFWDNNDGKNYTLRYRCLPGDTRSVSAAFHAT